MGPFESCYSKPNKGVENFPPTTEDKGSDFLLRYCIFSNLIIFYLLLEQCIACLHSLKLQLRITEAPLIPVPFGLIMALEGKDRER